MQLRMWMLDIAREQAPTHDHLRTYCRLTIEAGFDALGLYLEHRYAYPSTPWSHGVGCVTPDMIAALRKEFPELRLIPFVNLLGHFEGFLYTEEGKRYRESVFQGMQACPSNPAFVELCKHILDDTMAAFDDEIIHIGGDETWQLGQCALCSTKQKTQLYGGHFGPLAAYVASKGRRPAVWGDMFLAHPEALSSLPKNTLIFDWQYFNGCAESAGKFQERGLEVVGCPAIQTYNATWMHVEQSEENVKQITRDVISIGGYGVCVTTWECALFGSYDTLFPALRACGQILKGEETTFLKQYLHTSETFEEWARLMGIELQSCGGTFAPGRIRSSLKVRLLLNANPFLAWLHHGEELSGEVGDKAISIFERALAMSPNEAYSGVTLFARSAVEFVRIAQEASQEYSRYNVGAAVSKLAITRQIFDDLKKVAKRTHERIGGSLADVYRCETARDHVERVISRIKSYGDGSLGYLPAFEHITHPKFVPHDQGAWWLINRWANE